VTERWTAPEAGWYRLTAGREPEYLGTEQPTIDHDSDALTVISFAAGTLHDVRPGPFTVPHDRPLAVLAHFDQGTTAMNSSGRFEPGPEQIVVSWESQQGDEDA
jgi:hypothetical protein